MKTHEFLQRWFRPAEESSYWTVIGPKRGPFTSLALSNLDCIDETVKRMREDPDVGRKSLYFRIHGLAEPPSKNSKRGLQSETALLPGFVFDIDVGEKKNGKQYFPDIDSALAWVAKNLQYTMVVRSKTGLHVYICLDEPFRIISQEDYQLAYNASKGYLQWVRQKCPYDLDSTYDLARVFRLPIGKIEVIDVQDRSITMDAIKNVLSIEFGVTGQQALTQPLPPAPNSTPVDFVLDPARALPTAAWTNLISSNTAFAAAWSRETLPEDASASGLRLSILSFCFTGGMQVQDAVDVTVRYLLDMAKLPVDKLKLNRLDLWASDIAKVKYSITSDDDLEEIKECADRGEQLKAISVLMTLPPEMLTGLWKSRVEDVDENGVQGLEFTFEFTLKDGEVVTISTQTITNRNMVCNSIFAATGVMPEKAHGANKATAALQSKWSKAMMLMWSLATDSGVIRNTTRSSLEAALIQYVNKGDLAVDLEDAKKTGRVYIDEEEGVVVVPSDAFQREVAIDFNDLRSGRSIHHAVLSLEKQLDCKVKCTQYQGVRFSCYTIPKGFLIDPTGV